MKNNFSKWALILGIAIVLNLFFTYALKIIYKTPQWDNFCKREQVVEKVKTEESCLKKGGQWNKNIYPAYSLENKNIPELENIGHCNLQFTCSQNFQEAQKNYEGNIFIMLVILGVISMTISLFIANIEAVSVGLSFGGVLSFVIASIRYWHYANQYLQLAILGLALATLIWLGIKKIK